MSEIIIPMINSGQCLLHTLYRSNKIVSINHVRIRVSDCVIGTNNVRLEPEDGYQLIINMLIGLCLSSRSIDVNRSQSIQSADPSDKRE